MAFNIEFKRTFEHRSWRDRKDRVKADGPDGFNVRFKALEADLDTLRERFKDVNAALNKVATPVPSQVSVSPILRPIGNEKQWWIGGDGSSHIPFPETQSKGIVDIPMPTAGLITSFTAVGRFKGTGFVRFEFFRVDPTKTLPDKLAQLYINGAATDDVITVAASIDRVQIDPNSTYVVLAEGNRSATGEIVRVSALRVTIADS
ncbi:hypothetical protein [Nocardia altamirensis]|uniref:hypothetical protein n=1 Tax=Nocardia altamirensis TaxID=472158 RepID=UPI0008405F44|nr:hypothetical protein [Nocardia altamirensis]